MLTTDHTTRDMYMMMMSMMMDSSGLAGVEWEL